jgi:hypothetical protein
MIKPKLKTHMGLALRNSKGFSTLFIVVILGSAMMGLVLTLATSSFLSVKSGANIKNSNQTKALVNACAEVALEKLRENNNYIGTNNVLLGGNTCNYTITNTGGSNRAVSVSGSVGSIVRKIEITTSAFNPLAISSWQEVE